ncbi:hypothetical protein [Phytohabitans suffuscus]|uniref:TrbL/VirB6 plasmid conjugal transfer protein n=1 Tax=Phytohabitans suffuscus TaxID=624315 RepID=A0A6F8YK92_9ACTN|nr:hypothetical protein [Phytohabitans suffuscus]BCB86532.1 hypothetical protein Psuf_038450 [Phytohabitans suffuscus]
MAECATGDVVSYSGGIGKIRGFFEQGIDGILSDIASAIMSAAVDLFSDLGDIPTLGGEDINKSIHLQTNWLVVTIAVASLLAAAFRMALERRGQPGTEALRGLVRLVLTAGAAWFVLNLLAQEADAYTKHLYDQGIKAQLELIANCNTDGFTAFLLIIIGLLLLIAGVIHIILMYIRLGVMTLLTGTLPLAAAASMSEWGGGWWRKHIAWMVAWLAFKPVVGLIMYAGAAMIGATGDNAKHFKLAGAGVLLLAGVALPALMRLVVPAMASLGAKDNVAGGVAAGAAATGAVASGATKLGAGATSLAAKGKSSAPTGGAAPGGDGGGDGAGGANRGGRGRRTAAAAGTVVGGALTATGWAARTSARAVSGANRHGQGLANGSVADE